jgi:preprotein translocase subunit SecG
MINLLIRFFKSGFFKLLMRITGSLATAVIVISGYLAILNLSTKYQKNQDSENSSEPEELESEQEKSEERSGQAP